MEQANQPATVNDLSEELTPSAHAPGVPRVEVVVAPEPDRPREATWPKNLALSLVIVATSLYLLEQLQLVLRPLLIAILLCYLIVPAYHRLRKRMRPIFSFLLIIMVIVVGLQVISRMVFSDMTRINSNLPRYQRRAEELSDQARDLFEPFLPPSLLPAPSRDSDPSDAPKTGDGHLQNTATTETEKKTEALAEENAIVKAPSEPSTDAVAGREESKATLDTAFEDKTERIDPDFVGPIRPPSDALSGNAKAQDAAIPSASLLDSDPITGPEKKREPSTTMVPPSKPIPTESPTWELTRRLISQVAGALASFLLESLVVAFYMIFLLQEVGRFGDRIRTSFSREHATKIEAVAASINRAITDYLSVKVKSSLIVAVPTALTVYAFGITGAATWGVLAFFGNFLPYVGGLVATLLPVTLAYLEFDSLVYPTMFAVVLIAISGVTSNLIEPAMTGKALDLSPLVVMIGLAFWSLLWGFVGMCLAIPLTVVLKIILEHTPATRPIARLLGESQRPG